MASKSPGLLASRTQARQLVRGSGPAMHVPVESQWRHGNRGLSGTNRPRPHAKSETASTTRATSSSVLKKWRETRMQSG